MIRELANLLKRYLKTLSCLMIRVTNPIRTSEVLIDYHYSFNEVKITYYKTPPRTGRYYIESRGIEPLSSKCKFEIITIIPTLFF